MQTSLQLISTLKGELHLDIKPSTGAVEKGKAADAKGI